jgi:hypothetical protein
VQELAVLRFEAGHPAVARLVQLARNTVALHTFMQINSCPALAPLPMPEAWGENGENLHVLFRK